jgi:hypothetical protein
MIYKAEIGRTEGRKESQRIIKKEREKERK